MLCLAPTRLHFSGLSSTGVYAASCLQNGANRALHCASPLRIPSGHRSTTTDRSPGAGGIGGPKVHCWVVGGDCMFTQPGQDRQPPTPLFSQGLPVASRSIIRLPTGSQGVTWACSPSRVCCPSVCCTFGKEFAGSRDQAPSVGSKGAA